MKIGFAAGTGGSVDNHDVWGLVSQAADPVDEEPVDEPGDNGGTEEELADTGLDSELLWYGFALFIDANDCRCICNQKINQELKSFRLEVPQRLSGALVFNGLTYPINNAPVFPSGVDYIYVMRTS